MLKTLLSASGIAAGLMGPIAAGAAADTAAPWTYNAIVDNDSFFGIDDRHYTNGLYLSMTSPAEPDCGFCGRLSGALSLPADGPVAYRTGYFLGQSMFTPGALSLADPDPKDRPYAGWLYLGARVYRESTATLDRLEVKLGGVGPGSGADAVQRWWHALHWFGGVPPEGWHHQLKDEPGLVLTEQRIWRVTLLPDPFGMELLPQTNVSVGNVFTYAGAGISWRVGQNLRADWGGPHVEPGLAGADFIDERALAPLAWYVYVAVEGRAVARNLFLDGNSFQHSASVDKEPFVADVETGVAVLSDWVGVRMSYTRRSAEFKSQHRQDEFVSVVLSFLH